MFHAEIRHLIRWFHILMVLPDSANFVCPSNIISSKTRPKQPKNELKSYIAMLHTSNGSENNANEFFLEKHIHPAAKINK